ncbi:OmpH family outer membrane protein [bacterium]|nr:OmpH family outer membrane protein [bacterium]
MKIHAVVMCGMLAAAGAFAADSQQAAGQATPVKFGYIDTERVLQASLEFKQVDREARDKVDLKEEEGQKMLADLKKVEDEMAQLAPEKRESRMIEYRRKREELVAFQQQSRDEILEKQSVDLKAIANKIKNIIEQLSQEMQMTLVFDLKPILYLDRAQVIDMSDQVIARLNKDYEADIERLKRKAPARVQ